MTSVAALRCGAGLVTLGAVVVAVPLGVTAAVCLSDILPFRARQVVKPVVEVLAAIPSVAYGFFALIVFAPLLQSHGGLVLAIMWWCLATPIALLPKQHQSVTPPSSPRNIFILYSP